MKPAIFIDKGYVLTLVNAGDKFPQQAQSTSQRVSGKFLTTEAVLVEIGNALSRVRW